MSKNDEGRIVVRHLAESLMPARKMAKSGVASWLDFGSGAGFPAIPLIVAGVGKKWLLVESRRQKTLFLKRAIQELKLEDVGVVATRLEKLEPAPAEFEGFTSRATEGIDLTLELAARHIGPGGRAFLWQKASWPEGVAGGSWKSSWDQASVTRRGETIPPTDGQPASCVVEFLRR
jgi:16S rRNA (guanine527-N7)-methyltransferase